MFACRGLGVQSDRAPGDAAPHKRRGWDSNPRYLVGTHALQACPFGHSGTSPYAHDRIFLHCAATAVHLRKTTSHPAVHGVGPTGTFRHVMVKRCRMRIRECYPAAESTKNCLPIAPPRLQGVAGRQSVARKNLPARQSRRESNRPSTARRQFWRASCSVKAQQHFPLHHQLGEGGST